MFLKSIATFVLAFALGLATAWLVFDRIGSPPELPVSETESDWAAALPGSATPTDAESIGPDAPGPASAAGVGGAAQARSGNIPAGSDSPDLGVAAATGEDDKVLVPAPASADRAPTADVSLIERGPGSFAIVDLESGGVETLTIREGAMERDGGGSYRDFARNAKLGEIRGERVRVELLHAGFDREGRPIMAHIRTTGTPPVEGVIALRLGERFVRLLPVPAAISAGAADGHPGTPRTDTPIENPAGL